MDKRANDDAAIRPRSRATLRSSFRTFLASLTPPPEGFGPRLLATASSDPSRAAFRHDDRCELYSSSRRSKQLSDLARCLAGVRLLDHRQLVPRREPLPRFPRPSDSMATGSISVLGARFALDILVCGGHTEQATPTGSGNARPAPPASPSSSTTPDDEGPEMTGTVLLIATLQQATLDGCGATASIWNRSPSPRLRLRVGRGGDVERFDALDVCETIRLRRRTES